MITATFAISLGETRNTQKGPIRLCCRGGIAGHRGRAGLCHVLEALPLGRLPSRLYSIYRTSEQGSALGVRFRLAVLATRQAVEAED
jgi:hypothetical protein